MKNNGYLLVTFWDNERPVTDKSKTRQIFAIGKKALMLAKKYEHELNNGKSYYESTGNRYSVLAITYSEARSYSFFREIENSEVYKGE